MAVVNSKLQHTLWVALLGLDGSGKSTVLAELEKIFAASDFAGVQIIYRHPGFLYNRWLQSYQERNNHSNQKQNAINHYAKPPHGSLRSMVKLSVLALDWFISYWVRIAPQQAKDYLMLSDRHFFLDMSIDPLRYRYGGPGWLVQSITRLLPNPNLVILLDAPIEVLQSRKQEIAAEEAIRQRSGYLSILKDLPNGHIVDASQPLTQVVAQIEQIILSYIGLPAHHQEEAEEK